MDNPTPSTPNPNPLPISPAHDNGPSGEPSDKAKALCTPTTTTPITGSCHCGNISVTVPGKPQHINACHCGICYRYGAEWGYYLRRDVQVHEKEGARTETYIWGQREIAFHACDKCHCIMYWWPAFREEDGGARVWNVGVNTRMMHWEVWSRVERRTEFMEY